MEFKHPDWFTGRVPHWLPFTRHLPGTPCRLLEIGCFEGRSAVWMLQHLCTHPESRLVCIDPWSGQEQQEPIGTPEHEKRFVANVLETGRAEQLTKIKARSCDALPLVAGPFDLIYIDGDHNGRAAMEDAVLCWRKLKPGGILVFDDYLHDRGKRRPPGETEVRPAVDAFLLLYATQLKLLHKDWQVIVRKIGV